MSESARVAAGPRAAEYERLQFRAVRLSQPLGEFSADGIHIARPNHDSTSSGPASRPTTALAAATAGFAR